LEPHLHVPSSAIVILNLCACDSASGLPLNVNTTQHTMGALLSIPLLAVPSFGTVSFYLARSATLWNAAG
jgi:hypothetical protein